MSFLPGGAGTPPGDARQPRLFPGAAILGIDRSEGGTIAGRRFRTGRLFRLASPIGGSIQFLGIDVGTGGTRALLIDERGRVVASGTEEHAPFASPHPGWA